MARIKSFKIRAKECRDKVIQLAGELHVELYSEEEVYFNTLNQEE